MTQSTVWTSNTKCGETPLVRSVGQYGRSDWLHFKYIRFDSNWFDIRPRLTTPAAFQQQKKILFLATSTLLQVSVPVPVPRLSVCNALTFDSPGRLSLICKYIFRIFRSICMSRSESRSLEQTHVSGSCSWRRWSAVDWKHSNFGV